MPARVATPQIPKDRTQGDTCCNKVSKHLKCGEINEVDVIRDLSNLLSNPKHRTRGQACCKSEVSKQLKCGEIDKRDQRH